MDDFLMARVIHIASVVLWIGGVAFVTTVALPAIRRDTLPDERLSGFHRFERGFARQARVWVALAGLSGFWMVWRAGLWERFGQPQFWWMTAMVAVWTMFAMMLFVLEPLVIHKRMRHSSTPAADFRRMEIMHRVLLAASLITIIGAAGGSHGLW
ncbi:MAG: hypothetical protein H6916_08615 [Novosphingobium sp.]|uniref:hypothetical protein n=1 Tax=Novosphingobium sp. TaxID=1874826 RepID=UPI002608E698|nr:hypothetical protein [Novosphingobium sp.]MCP5386864.1 hypothetical protein [Novosphingobium sp.]